MVNGYLEDLIVGRVLRSSTTGFDCGTHSTRLDDRHSFGAFVEAPIANRDDVYAIGLIYAVRVDDDPLVSELVRAETVEDNVLRDQRENRLIPVEISVINIGWRNTERTFPGLPPRPPMSLADVTACDRLVVSHFTSKHDFFRLVLNAAEVPSDDLLAAALHYASARAYEPDERETFMIDSGRKLVRLLSHDLKRLAHLLELIRP
ncbi:MAG: hypothetical protein HXY40_16130 [Chloroflexi bacterium]|nr:hypothetical protein [Chloroflexota bacterium]